MTQQAPEAADDIIECRSFIAIGPSRVNWEGNHALGLKNSFRGVIDERGAREVVKATVEGAILGVSAASDIGPATPMLRYELHVNCCS